MRFINLKLNIQVFYKKEKNLNYSLIHNNTIFQGYNQQPYGSLIRLLHRLSLELRIEITL